METAIAPERFVAVLFFLMSAACLPGTKHVVSMIDGTVSCQDCPYGTYQSDFARPLCVQCPSGKVAVEERTGCGELIQFDVVNSADTMRCVVTRLTCSGSSCLDCLRCVMTELLVVCGD